MRSVLFVDQFREVAGGQVVLQSLIAAARAEGMRVGVLAPTGGRLQAELRARFGDAIELHHLEELQLQDGRKGLLDVVRYLWFIVSVLRFRRLAARYDAVYINGGRLAAAFLLLSFFLRRRWIYHVHLCHARLEKLILAAVALAPTTYRVVAASTFIRDDLVRSVPALARCGRLAVIENCLGAEFERLSYANRQEACGPLQVALFGRVSPEKGHDLLPEMARRFPALRFVMVGRTTPENEPFLRSLMDRAPENLAYAGETRDLPRFIAEHGIQVSLVPSRWDEPFGLTSIESMAASCLTVVSSRGMLPVIAGRTGAFCFGDAAELESILARIETMSPAERDARAHAQHDQVKRHFGFQLFRDRFLALLGPSAPESQAEAQLPRGFAPAGK